MHKSDFGLIGLGVMGKSISLNVAENGFLVSVYNRSDAGEENVVSDFLETNTEFKNISGFTDLKVFVSSISRPRKIMLMVKAGNVIDVVIEQLLPFLEKDDIIIDGGNSYFEDTIRRTKYLENQNIHFIGCGVSGGEAGARKGPSIMPSGSNYAYNTIAPIFEAISAKDKNNIQCCTHVGTDGAGHFIKMVHNGIEYAEMQLLAEVYSLLNNNFTNEEIANVFTEWNTGEQANYLLEITIAILLKKENDKFLLDVILDKAKSKGTGSWSSQIAMKLGMPNTMMSSAVFARYISSFKKERTQLSTHIKASNTSQHIDLDNLKTAYGFARIINHQQGFQLIKEASNHYNWKLDFSEVARIWTNGCIIRSRFMEKSVDIFKLCDTYFDNKNIIQTLVNSESSVNAVLLYGLENRIALQSFSAANNYWIAMTTENSSANVIQAQRDYFGAHTYQRNDIDDDTFFHTNW